MDWKKESEKHGVIGHAFDSEYETAVVLETAFAVGFA